MNATSNEESKIKYYSGREGAGVWGALVALFGVICVGSSVAAHSFRLTCCFLLVTVAVGYLGYWVLSKSCYFISSSKAGFKDALRAREVQFDEIRSVTRIIGSDSSMLRFECNTRTVMMPLDILDEAWFTDLKAELLKRGIPVSSRAFGFTLDGE